MILLAFLFGTLSLFHGYKTPSPEIAAHHFVSYRVHLFTIESADCRKIRFSIYTAFCYRHNKCTYHEYILLPDSEKEQKKDPV